MPVTAAGGVVSTAADAGAVPTARAETERSSAMDAPRAAEPVRPERAPKASITCCYPQVVGQGGLSSPNPLSGRFPSCWAWLNSRRIYFESQLLSVDVISVTASLTRWRRPAVFRAARSAEASTPDTVADEPYRSEGCLAPAGRTPPQTAPIPRVTAARSTSSDRAVGTVGRIVRRRDRPGLRRPCGR